MSTEDRLRKIEERLQRIEEAVLGDLIKVTRLAAQLDLSTQTIRRRCRDNNIPLRTMHGDKWEPGRDSGESQYVSRRDWQHRGDR